MGQTLSNKAISILSSAIFAASALASEAYAQERLSIGFVTPGADAAFWIDAAKGAEKAKAELAEVDIVVGTGPKSGDMSGMVPILQNMMTRGVDAIVVPGVAQVVPALQAFKEAGIPIVFYANGMPGSDLPIATVNTDSVKGGELAGEFIRKEIGGTGQLAIIRYPEGAYPLIDLRVTGVLNAIGDKGVEVTFLDVGCDSPAPAVAAVQNLLTRLPNINAIFGQCGSPILGAQQALQQASVKPEDVVTVGYDGTKAEIEAILAGTQDATVAQFPVRMGELAVRTAYQVLKGETVPISIDSGTILITKDNAAAELDKVR